MIKILSDKNSLEDKDENKRKEVKDFVRTKLQTLIKAKATQKSLLGDKVKNFSVTIRKVNKPMIENAENVFCNFTNGKPAEFDEVEEKSIRVVLVSKEEKEQKGFLEQLEKLCEKHDFDPAALVIKFLLNEDLVLPIPKTSNLKIEKTLMA